MTSTPDFSKTESFASWDQLMLHIQLDSGPIVVPAIRVCQKADPHVHQQPWGFGDCRSGHLRHHAVRPTTHFNLVRRTGCFHGVTTLGCRISRNETLTAKCKNNGAPAFWWCQGPSN